MSKRGKLDVIDLKILTDLQNDGRMTNVDLARNVGISAPPCLRRVRSLEEQEFVRGYHADLNEDVLGFGVTVFAQVGLSSHSDKDLRAFQDQLQDWPLVREAYLMAGESDFILKVVARDWDEYQRFLTEELTAAPNVTNIRSSLAVGTAKREPGVPMQLLLED